MQRWKVNVALVFGVAAYFGISAIPQALLVMAAIFTAELLLFRILRWYGIDC